VITFPTVLTIGRFILVPFVVRFIVLQQWGAALVVFVGAALTDAVDGMIARRFNQCSQLGALLDPIADKLLILSTFAAFLFIQPTGCSVPSWFFYLVLCKEVVLSVCFVAWRMVQGAVTVPPLLLGKAAMISQSLFIIWLLACLSLGWSNEALHTSFLLLSAGLIVGALIQYLWYGFTSFRLIFD
jgi:cardiolipin synthase (CMP-forming)